MSSEAELAAERYDDRLDAMRLCLEKLSEKDRELLRLHYVLGRSIKDLSQELERGESALKMALLRLREQLSQCVTRRLNHPL
jgi:RNA polymerase sigma-70 factor (ECF subfamily)